MADPDDGLGARASPSDVGNARIPLRDRIRVDKENSTRPSWPRRPQRHPEGAVDIIERWTWPLALERGDLLTQREIFSQQIGPREKEHPDGVRTEGDEKDEQAEHAGQSVVQFG